MYHSVCMVAASWGGSSLPDKKGGIGGIFKNKQGRPIYQFSGPSSAQSIIEAEIIALLHALNAIRTTHLHLHKVVVCSASIKAIDSIYEGLHQTFPLLVPNFNISNLLENSVCINFVPSDLNEEAQTLANNGATIPFTSCRWAVDVN